MTFETKLTNRCSHPVLNSISLARAVWSESVRPRQVSARRRADAKFHLRGGGEEVILLLIVLLLIVK